MRKFLFVAVIASLVAAGVGVGLAKGKSQVSTPLAAKDLMKAELSAIRRDVAGRNWTRAWQRTIQLNAYWETHRRTHPGLKSSTIKNFRKYLRSLQKHIRLRSVAGVYLDIGGLRLIVIFLRV